MTTIGPKELLDLVAPIRAARADALPGELFYSDTTQLPCCWIVDTEKVSMDTAVELTFGSLMLWLARRKIVQVQAADGFEDPGRNPAHVNGIGPAGSIFGGTTPLHALVGAVCLELGIRRP